MSEGRDLASAGRTSERNWSNGTLSRKKKVSLVVMASVTVVMSFSSRLVRSAVSSADTVAKPSRRAIGARRLSIR